MDPIFVTNLLNVVYEISILGLVALGLAVVFGLLGVLNLAHGEFIMVGAYTTYFIQSQGLPFLTALPAVILVCGLMGLLVELILIRPLYRRPFDTLLVTWGLSLLLRELVETIFGKGFKSVTIPIESSVAILGAEYPAYRFLIMLISIALIGGLVIWFIRSATGRRIRAVVNNPELAGSVGIGVTGLSRNTFIFGTCLAGITGMMLAPIVPIQPFMGFDYILRSFFILVVGGLGSLTGLVTGSGLIGGVESIVSVFSGRTAGYTTVLVIAILFLWLRPNGIFSRS
jgi:urea transport system permease protein